MIAGTRLRQPASQPAQTIGAISNALRADRTFRQGTSPWHLCPDIFTHYQWYRVLVEFYRLPSLGGTFIARSWRVTHPHTFPPSPFSLAVPLPKVVPDPLRTFGWKSAERRLSMLERARSSSDLAKQIYRDGRSSIYRRQGKRGSDISVTTRYVFVLE